MVILILSFGDAVSKQVNREGGGKKQDKVAKAHAGEGLLYRVGGLQSHF